MKKTTDRASKSKPAKEVRQRVGMIIMATAMVEASWKQLMDVLGMKFFPFAIHVSPKGEKRAYVGFCEDFDEIGPKESPPQYVVKVDTNPRGGKTVTFEKVAAVAAKKETTKKKEARHGI